MQQTRSKLLLMCIKKYITNLVQTSKSIMDVKKEIKSIVFARNRTDNLYTRTAGDTYIFHAFISSIHHNFFRSQCKSISMKQKSIRN
jgi:hypothetical protein